MRHLGSAKRFISGALAMAILACPACLAAKADKAAESKSTKGAHGKLVAQAPKAAVTDGSGAALISILKDITKALTESSDYNNLSDAKQKAVVGIAITVLQTALANPQLGANRIITSEDKAKADNFMSAETWDSGEIVVRSNDPQSPVCHAVASCIWAKKANGLVNITIAGNSTELVDGQKLGDFIFVASGRSGIESGFDIQSQSSVNYWIGKLTQFVADTAGAPASQLTPVSPIAPINQTSTGDTTNTQTPEASSNTSEALPTPSAEANSTSNAENATEQKPEAKIEEPQAKPSQATNSSQVPATTPIANNAVSKAPEVKEEKAPRRSYLLLKAPSLKNLNKKQEATKPAEKPQPKPPVKAEVTPETKPEAKVEDALAPQEIAKAPQEVKTATETEVRASNSEAVAKTVQKNQAPAPSETTNVEAGKIETTMAAPVKAEPPVEVGPSADAMIVTPDKAQAGQLITVSVVNARLVAESGVSVDFNGTVLTTGANGQIQYLVPDDSTPGPSLKIAIAGRQLATTKVVHILQPLSTPDQPLPPHVDRVTANASKFDTVTIQGHNFNGQASNLSVTIDGKWEAQILSTSPLELKILVPEDVPAGQHSIAVTNAGLRSNAALFSLISLQVAPDARPGQVPTKLIVRALGTAKPVAVHLRNNTPNIITIVKGNDLRIKTPGGKDNSIAVSVRLKQRGNYNIEASIE